MGSGDGPQHVEMFERLRMQQMQYYRANRRFMDTFDQERNVSIQINRKDLEANTFLFRVSVT